MPLRLKVDCTKARTAARHGLPRTTGSARFGYWALPSTRAPQARCISLPAEAYTRAATALSHGQRSTTDFKAIQTFEALPWTRRIRTFSTPGLSAPGHREAFSRASTQARAGSSQVLA